MRGGTNSPSLATDAPSPATAPRFARLDVSLTHSPRLCDLCYRDELFGSMGPGGELLAMFHDNRDELTVCAFCKADEEAAEVMGASDATV